jgi:hypothetical protein
MEIEEIKDTQKNNTHLIPVHNIFISLFFNPQKFVYLNKPLKHPPPYFLLSL